MKRGAHTAAAVGAGYLLGRTKKMRITLMIAAAGATGKLGGGPREMLQQGMKQLSGSAEITKLTESVRGELLDAARAAAVTAASSRIKSLSERLQQNTDKRDTGPETDEENQPRDIGETDVEDTRNGADTAETDTFHETEDTSESGRRQPRRRPNRSRTESSTTTSRGESRGEPRTRARPSSGRSPVRRTRRQDR